MNNDLLMDQFSDDELHTLIEGFDSEFYLILSTKYKAMREIYLNRKTRSATPTTGALAMKALGEVQGQNLELNSLFKFPELCRETIETRNKTDLQSEDKVSRVSSSKPVNPLTNF